jgi:hypothetical protein
MWLLNEVILQQFDALLRLIAAFIMKTNETITPG